MFSNKVPSSVHRASRHYGLLTVLLWLAALVLPPFGGDRCAALAQPVTQPIVANTTAQALSTTNGNKVVVAPDGSLHAVYQESGGQLGYASSVNGDTWSKATLPYNAQTPTIAVAKAGASWVVGIAYADTTKPTRPTLRYLYKTGVTGAWVGPFILTDEIYSHYVSEPSLVGFDNLMHVTWVSYGSELRYADFTPNPTIGSTAVVSQSTFVDGLLTPNSRSYHPSIAVSKTGATNNTPLVKIAYFNSLYGTKLSVQVKVRTKPALASMGWEESLYGVSGVFSSDDMSLKSLSLAANPATGDFYLGFSWEEPGMFRETWLCHENAWNQPGNWAHYQLTNTRTQIDIATNNSAQAPLFRVAVSEVGSGGLTWHRTGQGWIYWLENPVIASSAGRDPQAIFWGRGCGTPLMPRWKLTWRDIYAVFTGVDNASGSGYALQRSNATGSCDIASPF